MATWPLCLGALFVTNFGGHVEKIWLHTTCFSYRWQTIPPKGWELVAQWLYGAIHQLGQLTGTPFP
jgi:hypothetical protein